MSHLVLAALLVSVVHADVYMHSPRGSNDRNCEKNVNRNNGNRLFDSQNNNKGGYACPRPRVGRNTPVDKAYYYPGSKLVVEWTAQHGSGTNPSTSSEVVIQYACEDTLDPLKKYRVGKFVGAPRDGTPVNSRDAATDRIPARLGTARARHPRTRRFGMHEGIDYYKRAQRRPRNKGLYTADQRVRNNRGALATRQNPNGDRRGLEVPEERDYYPYWEPSPWRDVAVITSNPARCDYYRKESANVKPRTVCLPKAGARAANGCAAGKARTPVWWDQDHPKTRAAQKKLLQEASPEQWSEVSSVDEDWMADEPKDPSTVDCVDGTASTSRENQLGNSRDTANPEPAIPHGINANRYIWTIPDHVQEDCVLRLRYNISTSDYWAWDNAGNPRINRRSNNIRGAHTREARRAARKRGKPSPVVQDPYVSIGGKGDFLSLAVNTNQYGRTFQDRSYVFAIRARPAGVPDSTKIYNLGVRGKRGNIVQTYPAVEYDFVPNDLCLEKGDMIHFQWQGSDYNPRRNPNDAEGGGDGGWRRGSSRADRNNLVEQDLLPVTPIGTAKRGARRLAPTGKGLHSGEVPAGMSYPAGSVTNAAKWGNLSKSYQGMFWTADGKPDTATITKLAFLDQDKGRGGKCLTMNQLRGIKNEGRRERHPRNCAKLNAATDSRGTRTPAFDGGLVTMHKPGRFSYMSTRNHNFSNRNQVGFICVRQGNTGQCSAGGCRATVEQELLAKSKGEQLVQEQLSAVEEDKSVKLADVLTKAREVLGSEAAKQLGQALQRGE